MLTTPDVSNVTHMYHHIVTQNISGLKPTQKAMILNSKEKGYERNKYCTHTHDKQLKHDAYNSCLRYFQSYRQYIISWHAD